MGLFRGRITYANVVSSIALFAALGGGAYATLVGTGGVISGCAPKHGGTLSVVRPGRRCPRGTVPLKFNARGRQGPPGSNATINGVTAGGDLTGTYPRPTIADGAITTSKFASGAQAPDAAQLAGQGPTAFGAVMSAQIQNVSGTANTTDYGAVSGVMTATNFGDARTQSPAQPLVARDFSVHSSMIGSPSQRTLELDVNGSGAVLQCSLPNDVGNCTDTTDAVPVPANSQLAIANVVGPSGAPSGANILVSFRLTSS